MKVSLEKKIYHIDSKYAEEKLLHISNHDEDGLKKVSRYLQDETDFHLDGNGATLIYHGDIIPFYIQNCTNVILENFTIRYDSPVYAQGIVKVTEPDYMELEIDSDRYPWKIRGGRCCFRYENQWLEMREWLEWDKERKAPSYEIRDVYLQNSRQDGLEVSYTAISENRLGIRLQGEGTFPEKSKCGNVAVIRHHMRTHPAIYICDSRNVTVKNVTIADSLGMGILAERTEDILLEGVQVKLLEERPDRVYSITADATHFVYCKGKIIIRNCLFENQMDDAVNVHGIYLRIHEVINDHTVIAEWVHEMHKGVSFGVMGDEIGIVDNRTMLTVDRIRIQSMTVYNGGYARIEFARKCDFLRSGFALENLEYVPDVMIENCTIRNNRARGVLATSAGKIVIQNNLFQTAGTAILIEGDANYWFESGATKDIQIRGNTFDHCSYVTGWGQAPIQVSPGVSKTEGEERYHQKMTICGNEFLCVDDRILKAEGVREIVFDEGENDIRIE